MRTSKPFSTISYNTAEYLDGRLSELITKRKIDFYAWIEHEPEEDEEKKHKHLIIFPNGQTDTDQVLDYLVEIDPKKPDKPFRCLRPRSSKFAPWYLYALHDTAYLASLGQSRKYHYTLSDVHASDNDYLREEIHTIDYSKLNKFSVLQEAVSDGVPFGELVRLGRVPIQQVFAWEKAYYLIADFNTARNGKQSHTPIIDPTTGEILPPKE